MLIPATLPHVVAAGIGWLIGGISNGVDNVTMNAIVRQRTPDEMRGRVFAVVGSMVTGANLLGTAAVCLVFVYRALRRQAASGSVDRYQDTVSPSP